MLVGTFALGMGDTLDKTALQDLPAGGYALLPAQMHHFAMAKTARDDSGPRHGALRRSTM